MWRAREEDTNIHFKEDQMKSTGETVFNTSDTVKHGRGSGFGGKELGTHQSGSDAPPPSKQRRGPGVGPAHVHVPACLVMLCKRIKDPPPSVRNSLALEKNEIII